MTQGGKPQLWHDSWGGGVKVAAYTSGRSSVSPHDCTLLQHVLWQRPEESERIADHILKQLATDERRLDQIDYLFKGALLPTWQSRESGSASGALLA